MNLGERIKTRRKELKISQVDFARKIRISVTALRKIEEGKTKNPRNIETIATNLEVNPAWLQFGNSSQNGALVLDENEIALLCRFRQLNQVEKTFIVKCITGLISETYK